MQGLTNLGMRLDPARLAAAAGITLDPWQEEAVRSRSKKMLLNCSRQAGKSFVAGDIGMHTALYQDESLVLLVSPSQRQSAELLRYCHSIYAASGQLVSSDKDSVLHLELQNGSRVLALPGTEKTLRGLANVTALILDEASRIPDSLFLSCLPFLAVSNGRLIALSTPWGARGWWYQCYLDRKAEGFEYFEVPATECPRISPEFLAQQKRLMADYWFQSEYMCKFLQPVGAVFSAEDIAALADPEVSRWTFDARPRRLAATA